MNQVWVMCTGVNFDLNSLMSPLLIGPCSSSSQFLRWAGGSRLNRNSAVRLIPAWISIRFWIIGFECSCVASICCLLSLTFLSLLGWIFLHISKKNIIREKKRWDNYLMKSSVSSRFCSVRRVKRLADPTRPPSTALIRRAAYCLFTQSIAFIIWS